MTKAQREVGEAEGTAWGWSPCLKFWTVSFFFLDATAILGKLHSLKLSESMQVLDAYITYLTELVRDFFKRAKPHRFSNYPWYDLQTE